MTGSVVECGRFGLSAPVEGHDERAILLEDRRSVTVRAGSVCRSDESVREEDTHVSATRVEGVNPVLPRVNLVVDVNSVGVRVSLDSCPANLVREPRQPCPLQATALSYEQELVNQSNEQEPRNKSDEIPSRTRRPRRPLRHA